MEEPVAYSLTDVTVYPDRAQVSCRGSVQLSPEVDTFFFDELPLSMEKESVRVSGTGNVAVRILSVDVVREHYEQSPSPMIQTLGSEIETVNEELQTVEDDITTWQAEADQLDGLRRATNEYAKGLARGRISVSDQNDLLVYIRTQDRAIRKEQRALESQARLLRRKLDKLQKDLSELHSAQPRSRYQVRISVAVEGKGQFSPELIYVVRNAQWQPLYDLHFVDNGYQDKELQISTHAQVSQRTGQDWDNVQLKVSTARPALNQRVPELKPWFIDSYEPPVPRPLQRTKALGGARQTVLADAAFTVEDALVENEEIIPAQMADASFQGENAIVTYKIAGSCNVKSDGAPHKFFLGEFTPQITLTYLSIPKHTDVVFRVLKAVNFAGAPLLAGQANLFFNDEFIGKTRIQYTPAEGELELLLGVEERIEVKRELTRRSVDKKLLKDHRVIYFAYEIKLENLLDEVAELELRDQLPVSRHEEIQVKLDEAKPYPTVTTEMNILEWKLKLEPQAETKVWYGYTVQNPRSMRVAGLQD